MTTIPKMNNGRVFCAIDRDDLATLALHVMESIPVNLQMLADRSGIILRSRDIKDNLRISARDGKLHIYTRAGASEEEQRYFAAFALAHVVNPDGRQDLYSQLEEYNIVLERNPNGALDLRLLNSRRDRQARALMQELLMPRSMLTSLYRAGARDVNDLSSMFRVSDDVMAGRLAQLHRLNVISASSLDEIQRLRAEAGEQEAGPEKPTL